MHTEFEIKFTSIDPDDVRARIERLGGVCTQPRTLMRRVVFAHPTRSSSYLRVRDEGGRVTTTYKSISDDASHIASVQEIECVVSDFDHMRDIYLVMGLQQKAYQETYREIWRIDGEIEFMIDEWPGIRPFVEIEGETEERVRRYVDLMGWDYEDGLFGAVDQLYLRELGIPLRVLNDQTPEITFANPPVRYSPN